MTILIGKPIFFFLFAFPIDYVDFYYCPVSSIRSRICLNSKCHPPTSPCVFLAVSKLWITFCYNNYEGLWDI